MKSNAFYNHIYHKIIFYYCRIVIFKIWNLNSTIVDWLIFTSLSQLNTFCMLHVNLLFHKGWNNVRNIFFFLWKLKRIKFTLSWCFLKIKFGDSLSIIVKIPSIIQKVIHVTCSCFDCVIVWLIWVVIYKLNMVVYIQNGLTMLFRILNIVLFVIYRVAMVVVIKNWFFIVF